MTNEINGEELGCQISWLRDEAIEKGDTATIALCERALNGEQDAHDACEALVQERRHPKMMQDSIEIWYTGRCIFRTLEAGWAWNEAQRRIYATHPRTGARKAAVGLFEYAWKRLLYLSGKYEHVC